MSNASRLYNITYKYISHLDQMFGIYIEAATFAQSSKYVIIVKTNEETKRSDVCTLWTSVPTFAEPVLVQSIDGLVIKACLATIDRKLTVIGSIKIEQQHIQQYQQTNQNAQDIVYEQVRDFTQVVEDKEVCVGNCRIRIVQNQKTVESSDQLEDVDDGFQLKSNEDSSQDTQSELCEMKLMIHCGFNFYLNSGFKVRAIWGKALQETKMVSNRINPCWVTTLNLRGNVDKAIELSVIDNKGSKLEWMKVDPKQIRIMYPYHLRITFREQYVGMHPSFCISLLRTDVPAYSILDKKINIRVKYVGPVGPQRTEQYLLVYQRDLQLNQSNRLPLFIDLDMKNYINFDRINKIIESSPDRKYEWSNWNLLVPINLPLSASEEPPEDCLTILKSFTTKPLACIYFSLDDSKSLFLQQVWNSAKVIDKRQSFQNCIKDIYYQERKIVMGKMVELSNYDLQGIEDGNEVADLEQKWKVLTHNYQLRKKLLTNSIATTEATKQQIKQKAEYLEHLKKIVLEVRKMNEIMLQKQKSAFMDQKVNKKIRENYQKYSTVEIVTLLIQKQIELERRKKINDQMRMRMDSLHFFNEDSTELDRAIVENAQKLLEQQGKIKQLSKMKEAIPKQREVIMKMEKMFQRREIDKQMNDMLKKQQQKLDEMKRAGGQNLEKVYNIVKQHKSSPHTLLQSIKAAESELIRLNAQYAKLTT